MQTGQIRITHFWNISENINITDDERTNPNVTNSSRFWWKITLWKDADDFDHSGVCFQQNHFFFFFSETEDCVTCKDPSSSEKWFVLQINNNSLNIKVFSHPSQAPRPILFFSKIKMLTAHLFKDKDAHLYVTLVFLAGACLALGDNGWFLSTWIWLLGTF